jgi:hypothetical protein
MVDPGKRKRAVGDEGNGWWDVLRTWAMTLRMLQSLIRWFVRAAAGA